MWRTPSVSVGDLDSESCLGVQALVSDEIFSKDELFVVFIFE